MGTIGTRMPCAANVPSAMRAAPVLNGRTAGSTGVVALATGAGFLVILFLTETV